MRRWTVIALIVLLLLLVLVALYQLQLAGRRDDLEERLGAMSAGP
jgi:hypothetical protein